MKKLTFWQIYKNNFKRTIKGRASRKDYTCFFIGNIILTMLISVLAYIVMAVLMLPAQSLFKIMMPIASTIAIGIIVFWSVIIFVLDFCISIRRFHDFNASGWWIGGKYIAIVIFFILILLGMKDFDVLISLLNFIYFLICVFVPSYKEANKYGEPVSHEIN